MNAFSSHIEPPAHRTACKWIFMTLEWSKMFHLEAIFFHVKISKIILLDEKNNSEYLNEISHAVASHLGQHWLQMCNLKNASAGLNGLT